MNKQKKKKKGRNKEWAKWNKLQKHLKEEKYYFVNECCFPEAPNASRKKTNISKIFVHMCIEWCCCSVFNRAREPQKAVNNSLLFLKLCLKPMYWLLCPEKWLPFVAQHWNLIVSYQLIVLKDKNYFSLLHVLYIYIGDFKTGGDLWKTFL